MEPEEKEPAKGMGLVLIVAGVVASAAIVAAAAVMSGAKSSVREDFLPPAPKEKAPLEAPVPAEDEAPTEEGPSPAEFLSRAEKLIAGGSAGRAEIEDLLLRATKARPGGETSLKAFKLLRSLYDRWREEDARAAAAPPVGKVELPQPPPPAPARLAPATTGFVSLIGADLSDWTPPVGTGTWKVEGGAILCECVDGSSFIYTRKQYADFTLKLKVMFLATAGRKPDLTVRLRWPGEGSHGCQAELSGRVCFNERGGEDRPFRIEGGQKSNVGSSSEVEFVVVGPSVRMLVKGREAFSVTTKSIQAGPVGIGLGQTSALFEKVEIKEH